MRGLMLTLLLLDVHVLQIQGQEFINEPVDTVCKEHEVCKVRCRSRDGDTAWYMPGGNQVVNGIHDGVSVNSYGSLVIEDFMEENIGSYHCILTSPNQAFEPVQVFAQLSLQVRCPELPAPEHGDVELNPIGPYHGHMGIYSCYPGYLLVGVSERTCLENRSWTEEAPVCQAVHEYHDEEMAEMYIYFQDLRTVFETTIREQQAQIDSLVTSIEENSNTGCNCYEEIARLEGRIEALEGDVAGYSDEVTILRSVDSELREMVLAQEHILHQHQEQLSNITYTIGNLEELITHHGIGDMDGTISDHLANIESLGHEIQEIHERINVESDVTEDNVQESLQHFQSDMNAMVMDVYYLVGNASEMNDLRDEELLALVSTKAEMSMVDHIWEHLNTTIASVSQGNEALLERVSTIETDASGQTENIHGELEALRSEITEVYTHIPEDQTDALASVVYDISQLQIGVEHCAQCASMDHLEEVQELTGDLENAIFGEAKISDEDKEILAVYRQFVDELVENFVREQSTEAFMACASGTTAYTFGDRVIFSNEVLDYADNYNENDSVFVCRQHGLYQFTLSIRNVPTSRARVSIVKNNQEIVAEVFIYDDGITDAYSTQAINTAVVECQEGEEISVSVMQINEAQTLLTADFSDDTDLCTTYFSGFMISPLHLNAHELITANSPIAHVSEMDVSNDTKRIGQVLYSIINEIAMHEFDRKIALTVSASASNNQVLQRNPGEFLYFDDEATVVHGNYYDPDTGVFTAPVAGLYNFILTISNAANHNVFAYLFITRNGQHNEYAQVYGEDPYASMQSNQVNLELNVGDSVRVKFHTEAGQATYGYEPLNSVTSLTVRLLVRNFFPAETTTVEHTAMMCQATTDDQHCVHDPFIYAGTTYVPCETVSWCAVTVDSNNNLNEWSYCAGYEVECSRPMCALTSTGESCVHDPYNYGSGTYSSCDGVSWCATSVDSSNTMVTWGYCSDPLTWVECDEYENALPATQEPLLSFGGDASRFQPMDGQLYSGKTLPSESYSELLSFPQLQTCVASCTSDCYAITYDQNQQACYLFKSTSILNETPYSSSGRDTFMKSLQFMESTDIEELREIVSGDVRRSLQEFILDEIIPSLQSLHHEIHDSIAKRSVAFSACTNEFGTYEEGQAVLFPHVITNTQLAYSETNSAFYCPFDGLYSFETTITNEPFYTMAVKFVKNGVVLPGETIVQDISYYNYGTLRSIVQCHAGDVITVIASTEPSSAYSWYYPMGLTYSEANVDRCVSSFSGYYLAPAQFDNEQ